jgi:hypothetical protein
MEMETNIFAFLGNMSHNVCGQLVMFTFDSTVHPYCSWGYVLENPCDCKTTVQEVKTLWEKWVSGTKDII